MTREHVYSQGLSSTATHNGKTYRLDILFILSRKRPVVKMKVSDLLWVLPHTAVNKKRLKTADVTIPLLVYKDPVYNYTVIDGAHRLSKAIEKNLKTIPAIILTDGDMAKAEITNNEALENLKLPSYLKW